MLEFISPISGKHSIARVQATVFIPQVILKPNDLFEKLKNIKGFDNYQKKTLTKSTTINFNKGSLGISNNDERGFVFEEYDKGKLKNSFRLENVNDKQAILQFETRIYSEWITFRDRFLDDLKLVFEVSDFYIEALSLNYVDEFLWTNPDKEIVVDCIFNKESDLLNKKFLSSKNGTLVLISQDNLEGFNSEEKTELTFNNSLKRIIINHQFALRLKEYKQLSNLINDKLLSEHFDTAHKENKTILETILTTACQEKIGLI